MIVTLTEYQYTLLDGIARSDFAEGLDGAAKSTYVWDACDGIPKASRGGVLAKAGEAGLIVYQESWDRINFVKTDTSTVGFTQLGWDSYVAARDARK
jgi:hypothetical protein